MFGERLESLRATAAAPTLERLGADRQALPKKLRPLADYIATHLFEPGFTGQDMAAACGVRDTSIATVFKWHLGDGPRAYVAEARLEVAARLLSDTQIEVWKVAGLVGYSDVKIFSRAFRRWCELPPTKYRKHMRQLAARLPAPEPDWISAPFLREVIANELPPERMKGLVERLRSIYGGEPAAAEDAPRVSIPLDGDTLERGMAVAVWASIEQQPSAVQLAAVRACCCPALFDLLCRESRKAGRQDRQRGVELMELALASLEGCVDILGDELADRQALGWARLGNARRLHLDFAGAEEAFVTAEAVWAQPRANRDPLVEGQICDLKATLRWFQRRFDEALALEDCAIGLFRQYEAANPLAEALVVRGSIHAYTGDPTAGIADLEAARGLAGLSSRLRFAIEQNLAWFHLVAGDAEAAVRILACTSGARAAAETSRERLHLRWVEALVDLAQGEEVAAERGLTEVYAGFRALGESGHAAAAALDLAILCESQGRSAEVAAWANEALPVFEAFRIHREAIVAFDLLHEAVAANRLTAALLCKARLCLGWLCETPVGRLRLNH